MVKEGRDEVHGVKFRALVNLLEDGAAKNVRPLTLSTPAPTPRG